MKTLKTTLALAMLALSHSGQLLAHARWILPSNTIVSGKDADYISFDLGVSGDAFVPERALGVTEENASVRTVVSASPAPVKAASPMPSAPTPVIEITTPAGVVDKRLQLSHFGRKSVFAANLVDAGTYRVAVLPANTSTVNYVDSQGKAQRLRGTKAEVAAKIPADAKDIRVTIGQTRIETYVTRNQTSATALKPVGQGLELAANGTHPNDLFAGETASWTLLIDGQPAPAGIKVSIGREGAQHRNNREVQELQTDEKGMLAVNWPQAGFYLLEAEADKPGTERAAETLHYSLFLTVEVSPQ